MKIISIKDKKAEMYTAPELVANVAVVERHLKQVINKESPIVKFAKDFACYLIGDYDEKTGKITPCEPMLIAELTEIFKGDENK